MLNEPVHPDFGHAQFGQQGTAVADVHTSRAFTFFADPDGLPLELYEQ